MGEGEGEGWIGFVAGKRWRTVVPRDFYHTQKEEGFAVADDFRLKVYLKYP